MSTPVTTPGTRLPPPRASAHALDRARALLERAIRLPSAERPVGPTGLPNRPRGLAAAAAALIAPFLTSDAELNLAKLTGRIPAHVGARDWQLAGMAFERWNARWRAPATWSPEQVGRSIEAAAALHERLSAGRMSPRQFDDAMSRLVRHIGDGLQPPATRSAGAPRRPADPPPLRPADSARVDDPAALRRQQAAQRGSDAVNALGRAIRSHGAAPTPARRSTINDAYALAKRLHARDGARHWTPATQRGFAAYGPQAERALYDRPRAAPPDPPAPPIARPGPARPSAPSPSQPGVPALEAKVTHTHGPGASTGAAADALNREALNRQAQAFENARRIVHERSRTLLPGGPSVAEVARDVYRSLGPELQAHGLGEHAFVARVQAPGAVLGMHGDGRIRATVGSGSGSPPPLGDPDAETPRPATGGRPASPAGAPATEPTARIEPAGNDPFSAIVPKVSKRSLDAELARNPGATTARILLGDGSEAYEGVHAVAMRTSQGIEYFVQKRYNLQPLAARAVPALELVAQLVDQGLMPGFDVVRVLQSSADSRIVHLSLVEGLAVEDLRYTEPGNPAYRQVAERYRQALNEAARRLEAAGWKAQHSSHERGDSLHVYRPGRPKGQAPLVFQVLESGVVATPDGRFVLIDPF